MTEKSAICDRWVEVGRMGRAKGLHGEIWVRLHDEGSSILSQVKEVGIGPGDVPERCFVVSQVSVNHKGLLVRLEGVESRTKAESDLVGHKIFVKRSVFPELPPGRHYCCDLEGCTVETQSGLVLGRLRGVMATGANDVYVVDGGGKEILLPAVPGVILCVDEEGRRIVVEPLEVVDAV